MKSVMAVPATVRPHRIEIHWEPNPPYDEALYRPTQTRRSRFARHILFDTRIWRGRGILALLYTRTLSQLVRYVRSTRPRS